MTQSPGTVSDIRVGDWVDRFLPKALRPYARLARLDRPIGTWLLLLPCWWGVALASPGAPAWGLFLLFALGAVVMRAAGCVINDLADRDIDRLVERTQSRPLASGAIGLKGAFAFLSLLLLIGFAVLMQLDWPAIVTGLAIMLVVVVYPLAKRVTYWPQLVLGLAFNWGALMGWVAIHGRIGTPSLLLYAAGICWTLGYDTIYAHQDKADDALIGVKSTALLLGTRTRPWLAGFYLATLTLLAAAGQAAGSGWPFNAGLALGGLHLIWQVASLDIDDPADCLAKFKSNRDFGLIVTLGTILGGFWGG
ncbi:MAG: 4-hydroxybenzoate octaprenyltransferase [Proteobacteria bacterium]|nr:4-hydroxybenzoate octaprenyltransferase [Pseudomonadota bacterium]MBI3496851.1 4-hydroxybenzoate octaprenyltransferase [Pseudomonadota bacterium]